MRVVHDKDEDGVSICNSSTCPRMSASTLVFVSYSNVILLI